MIHQKSVKINPRWSRFPEGKEYNKHTCNIQTHKQHVMLVFCKDKCNCIIKQLILHAANLPFMAPKGMCFLNATKCSCLAFPVVNIVEKFYPSAPTQTFRCSFVFLLKSSILKKMFHHSLPIVITTLSWQCFRLQYSTSFLATNSWLCSGMQLHSQEMSYDNTKAIVVEYIPMLDIHFLSLLCK